MALPNITITPIFRFVCICSLLTPHTGNANTIKSSTSPTPDCGKLNWTINFALYVNFCTIHVSPGNGVAQTNDRTVITMPKTAVMVPPTHAAILSGRKRENISRYMMKKDRRIRVRVGGYRTTKRKADYIISKQGLSASMGHCARRRGDIERERHTTRKSFEEACKMLTFHKCRPQRPSFAPAPPVSPVRLRRPAI